MDVRDSEFLQTKVVGITDINDQIELYSLKKDENVKIINGLMFGHYIECYVT